MSDSAPISWRTIIYGTPVMSSDGQRVGEVHEVLGDDADDIFHGLRVALPAPSGTSWSRPTMSKSSRPTRSPCP